MQHTDPQPTTADIMAAMTAMQNAMVGMENRIVSGVQERVKTEVTQQITPIKAKMDEIDKRLTTLEDKSKNKNLPPGIDVQTTNNGSKTVDVVVRGFKEKKSAESIISEIEDMLRTVRGGSQGVIIDVPSDPSNFGSLKFDSFDENLK